MENLLWTLQYHWNHLPCPVEHVPSRLYQFASPGFVFNSITPGRRGQGAISFAAAHSGMVRKLKFCLESPLLAISHQTKYVTDGFSKYHENFIGFCIINNS